MRNGAAAVVLTALSCDAGERAYCFTRRANGSAVAGGWRATGWVWPYVALAVFNHTMAPTTPNRIWLEVPYGEKDAAKAAGARWDGTERAWFAPRPGMVALQRWIGRAPLSQTLPGEDRSFGSELFVDLVPSTCWFTNVRSCIDRRDWDRLRHMVYRRAGNKCEACGAERDPGAGRWLEAHERWRYHEAKRVQQLARIICLCTFCHEATHFFFTAEVRGHRHRVLQQLMDVNGWSVDIAEQHVRTAYKDWERRSVTYWSLDLSILTNVGISVNQPPAAADRALVAASLERQPSLLNHLPDIDRATLVKAAVRQATPAPGWYPDPSRRYPHRWWDGSKWTDYVASGFMSSPTDAR